MKHALVIATHRAPDRPSIRVEHGDTVTLGERDADWPQFVWTDLATGLGGWVPAILFDRDSGEATALRSYDTHELDADQGERIALHHELADWWWAENNHGTCGWIPARVLRILDDSDNPET
ncbi:SH3 domain-containing protein [Lysobacter niabensis]|uniref:SH3 domain-containing protein n=1 Tax=Agrilutibacter niabensis TaxID=380628 RepID=UPI00360A96EB